MRWDQIAEAWTARLLADPALVSVLDGNHVYPAQANRPVRIPSVEYLFTSDAEVELWNPMRCQVDIFAKGLRKAAQIERRVRTLTHSDVGQELDGERLWLLFANALTVDYPADPGVVHRILEFDFVPLREKYVTV